MNDISLLSERAAALLDAHQSPRPLVLPTVWDVWSATTMVAAGYQALSIGSHPLAESLGYSDGETVPLSTALEGIARITSAVDVPVTADLESGYDTPAPDLIAGLLEAGAVGVNIEDTVHSAGRMRTAEEHAAYISDLRQAAEVQRVHVVINARTDVFPHSDDFAEPTVEVIRRLQMCATAGADSVYPVGVPDTATLQKILAEVPLPLNVTAHPVNGAIPDGLSYVQLAELGVSRITFGPLLQATLADTMRDLARGWHPVPGAGH